MLRPIRSVLALTALSAVLVGCTGSGPETAQASARDARIAAVRAARDAVGDAASTLGEAANETDAQVSEVRLSEISAPSARRDAVNRVRAGALADLQTAIDAAADVTIPGDSPDVTAARAAWDRAQQDAAHLAAAARDDLGLAGSLADAEVKLDDVVAGWDQPGSYSQQLARFADLTDQARQVLDTLRALPPPPCSAYLQRRMDAAHAVISETVELRGLIQRRAGNEFDARREALAPDPFGIGALLSDLDNKDASCWKERGRTPVAVADVRGALQDLVTALNPELDPTPGQTDGPSPS